MTTKIREIASAVGLAVGITVASSLPGLSTYLARNHPAFLNLDQFPVQAQMLKEVQQSFAPDLMEILVDTPILQGDCVNANANAETRHGFLIPSYVVVCHDDLSARTLTHEYFHIIQFEQDIDTEPFLELIEQWVTAECAPYCVSRLILWDSIRYLYDREQLPNLVYKKQETPGCEEFAGIGAHILRTESSAGISQEMREFYRGIIPDEILDGQMGHPLERIIQEAEQDNSQLIQISDEVPASYSD